MTWNPDPLVTINGTDYSGIALRDAQIVFGRTSIWEQARASFANISLLNADNSDFGINANNVVLIKVRNSSGTYVTLFTGKVTNIYNTIDSYGTSGSAAIQRITAVGVFAEMARTIIGDTSWAKEHDDVRMARIFTDAGVSVDVVDTPAVYEFTSRAASAADSYSLAAQYAAMALGYIYETPDGKVGYANESRRFIDQRDNGYFEIPLSYILSTGISSQKSFTDVMNDLTLTYKSNAEVTSTDTGSQTTYGLKAAKVSTEIETNTDAQTQADRYIALRAQPRTSLSSFTIPVDSESVSNTNRDHLLGMNMGEAIEIIGLPNAIKNSVYKGFVEGWSWNITRNQVALTLTSTDYTLSVTPTRWQDVTATLKWSDVDPTLQWYNYA